MEQPLRDHTGLNEDMISKNGGTDYRPKGDPRRVNVHDFEDKELSKVVPYGVYDVTANAGWGSVGITCDQNVGSNRLRCSSRARAWKANSLAK